MSVFAWISPVHIGGWVAKDFTLNASQGAQKAVELRSLQNLPFKDFYPVMNNVSTPHQSTQNLK